MRLNHCGEVIQKKIVHIAKSWHIFGYSLLIVEKCIYVVAKLNHLVITGKCTEISQASHSKTSTVRSNLLAVTIYNVLYALKCYFLI